MIESHRINSLFDADVVDADGSRIGTVKHVYTDPDGGRPLFAGVATGWFGRSESFVPLREADFDGEVLHVQYDKDTVKQAPRIDADGTLTDDDIDRIQDYYDGGGGDEPAPGDDGGERQRPARERIRVHRYVIADGRTGTTPLSHDGAMPDRGRDADEIRYVAVEESRAEPVDGSAGSSADDSRDLGGGELRRRRE